MLSEYDAGRDPLKTMNVLKALRWGFRSWEMDVEQSTVERCFRKALRDPDLVVSRPGTICRDISSGIVQLEESGSINEAMDINQFLNPVEECMEDYW